MRVRYLVAVLAALAMVPLLAAPALGQDEAPRTPWGAPDLQGVWDFRTITPLQRPEELGDQEFLSEEEAASREQAAVARDIELWEAAPRRTEAGGSVGAYNNFWMDRGTNVIETRRTSLIIDPPNGRMPPLTGEGSGAPRSGGSAGPSIRRIRGSTGARSTAASSASTRGRR